MPSWSELGRDVGIALSQSDTLSRPCYSRCAEATVHFLDAAFGAHSVVLPPGKDVLELQASAGLYTHLRRRATPTSPVGRLKIGRIAQERRPVLTNEVARATRASATRSWARREGMIAFAGFPSRRHRIACLGVLAMFSRRPLSEAACWGRWDRWPG